MKGKPTLLLHPLFILSLILLLLNDFYLKYEIHNWFTGKLSDFSGIFIFPLFFTALLPRYKDKVFILSALFFIWWKSELSEPFISFCNRSLSLKIGRVADYSDLVALMMLPVAYYLKPIPTSIFRFRKICINSVLLICPLAFCNTSMPKHMMYDYDRENVVSYYEAFSTSLNEEEILEKLEPGQAHHKESVKFYRLRRADNFYYKITKDSTILWAPVTNTDDSSLFVKQKVGDFYTIPQYILDKDTLKNLELNIYYNPRKRRNPYTVELRSFQTNNPNAYRDFYQGKKRRQYKKHFKALFQ